MSAARRKKARGDNPRVRHLERLNHPVKVVAHQVLRVAAGILRKQVPYGCDKRKKRFPGGDARVMKLFVPSL
jgi:hypothetical protein